MTARTLDLSYHTLDVFTDRVFGGNPLAVVLDAPDLGAGLLQSIAREFNYSETVFVYPPETPAGHRRIRIFTPGRELPFAGHPTVGTALLLAELGVGEADRITLEEEVGSVPVRIERRDGRPVFAELTVPRAAEFGPSPDPGQVAQVIGLDSDDIDVGPGGLGTASCGVPFVLVRVRTEEALARARGDVAAWRAHLAGFWALEVYVYWESPDGLLRARMFAPGMGIPEDPATGAAAAALAAWLGRQAGTPDGESRRAIHQGIEMGRPSTLQIAWRRAGDVVSNIRVGGTAVRVATGIMRVEVSTTG